METELYMAMSVDGSIASNTGSEDFLSEKNWSDFSDIAEEAGAFVVGKKTYKKVNEWENHSYDDIDAKRIVLTTDDEIDVGDGYTKSESPEHCIKIAKDSDANKLVVTGGASTNSSFFNTSLIDKVSLNIEPIIVGDGIRLVDEDINTRLKFVRMSRKDDLLRLEYKVRD
jgi:riboflavin biosynthesis pyrimidine reductase